MNKENKNITNYIFFLQNKVELDNNFYLLAEVFSNINISLLPILSDDLKNMSRDNKSYLISIRNDLSSSFNFNQTRKSFLDSVMASGKIALFDISSFSEIEIASKYQKKNIYRFFQLPLNLKQIAMSIAVDYFRDKNKDVEWPGGKKSKLPSMEVES